MILLLLLLFGIFIQFSFLMESATIFLNNNLSTFGLVDLVYFFLTDIKLHQAVLYQWYANFSVYIKLR